MKSHAEIMREFISTIENKDDYNPGPYDMELEVENWRLDDLPDDLPDEKYDEYPSFITLGVNASGVTGYRPGTLTEPPDLPDIEHIDVYDADTGKRITDLPQNLKDHIEQKIFDQMKNSSDEP